MNTPVWMSLQRTLALLLLFCQCSASTSQDEETAVFAAGCFWSVELVFDRVEGVKETSVGYIGGSVQNPTYNDVTTGKSGQGFNPLDRFICAATISMRSAAAPPKGIHDPTTLNRQGGDRGTQYRSGIYVYSAEQLQVAQAQKAVAEVRLGQVVVTEIVEAPQYWPAEDYHQDYLWKGGQEKTKGSLKPIQCYGNRGPIKDLSKPGIEALLRSSPVGSATKDEL
eukprot:gene4019-10842_t